MSEAERLASLGTMAAGVAHEINNPLAIIAEAAGWLKSRVKKEQELPDDLRDKFTLALGKIEVSVDRAKKITHQLLTFARQQDSMVKEIDLDELVAEVIELVKKNGPGRPVRGQGGLPDRGNAYLERSVPTAPGPDQCSHQRHPGRRIRRQDQPDRFRGQT